MFICILELAFGNIINPVFYRILSRAGFVPILTTLQYIIKYICTYICIYNKGVPLVLVLVLVGVNDARE